MPRGKEFQYDLWLNGEFKIPSLISNLENGPEIIRVTSERKILEEKKEKEADLQGKYCDLRNNIDIAFRFESWNAIDDDPKRKKAAAIMVCKPIGLDNYDNLLSEASSIVKKLKKGSPLFIFEEKGEGFPKDEKLSLLEKVGLVERKVLTSKSLNFNLLEGRREKTRIVRSIDLLDKEKYPKSYNNAVRLWRIMEANYKKENWKIVKREESPIIARLHASKYPQGDYKLLKDGCGVTIENIFCGCTYYRDLKGADHEIRTCGTDHHPSKKVDKK